MPTWRHGSLPSRWTGGEHPTFVGRRTELAELDQAWAAAAGGARQVVFIGGEPGAGKSRLVAEAATRCHASGGAVLLGGCLAEFGQPYQPFVEPLEKLAAAVTSGELVVDGSSRLETTRRLRRLIRTAGGAPAPAEEPAVHRYQRELYDTALGTLHTAAADRPIVLVLEDLHWAGAESLHLLSFLVQHTAESRLLVLATHRTTGPDRAGPLLPAISELYRLDGVQRLGLGGLEVEDIADLLRRDSGVGAHRARLAARALREQSGGNPFFLRELLRDVTARGGASGVGSVGSVGPGEVRTPESVREIIETRLAGLDAEQRQAIDVAAVLGETVDVATLLDAADATRASTLTALDAAVALTMLEPVPGTDTAYRFPHSLARQAVLDLMPPSRRARTHARIAAVLEARPGAPLRVQRLAHHYASCAALGYTDQAVRYLIEAGGLADQNLAHRDAARFYERAASLALDADRADEIRLMAARRHVRGGDFARARELDELVATTGSPRNRLRAAVDYEVASWRPGRLGDRAVELLTAALRNVPADPADALYVRALGSLGRALAFAGLGDEAAALCNRSLELARALGGDETLGHALQSGMQHRLRPQDVPRRLELADELTALAKRTGDLDHLGPASSFRSTIAYLQGDPAALAAAHADLLRTARTTGDDFWTFIAGCVTWGRRFFGGDLASAEETCSAIFELGASFGSDDTEGPYGIQMFMIRRETGALEQVRGLISGDEPVAGRWAPGLLALYTELGLSGPASRLLWTLLDLDLGRYRDSADWPGVLVFLVEAALALGDKPAAERLRPFLAEYAGLNLCAGAFVAVFGSADRYLGSVDSLLGRGEPDDWFASALAMDTRMEAPVHQAQTLAAWSEHLRGDPASAVRAAELATRARSLGESLGLTRTLRSLPATPSDGSTPPGPRDGTATHPDGLTARELEVLGLLSEGLSNRGIGQRLFIAENTAANHVRSIMQKTGAANRTQAARYAAERGTLDRASPAAVRSGREPRPASPGR